MNIQSFDFKKYEVKKLVLHEIPNLNPLAECDTLEVDALKKQLQDVSLYNWIVKQNSELRNMHRKEVADMAQKFRRDAMNLIFPNLNEAEQDLIYSFICETLGIENSLDERLNIFHALLHYHQVTLKIFKQISNDPRW